MAESGGSEFLVVCFVEESGYRALYPFELPYPAIYDFPLGILLKQHTVYPFNLLQP